MSDLNQDEVLETHWQGVEGCKRFAAQFASAVTEPCCIALVGTLGAGKTQFVRFLVEALGGDASQVSSPTFVLVNMYHASFPIAHLDLYRLERPAELESFGFDDIVYGDSVCLIEWADKFRAQMPQESLWMHIKGGGDSREVCLSSGSGTLSADLIGRLRESIGDDN